MSGGEALVTAEYHADGGVDRTWLQRVRRRAPDRCDAHRLGRTSVAIMTRWAGSAESVTAARLLTDYYAYDGLGRRIRHWNNLLGSGGRAHRLRRAGPGRRSQVAFGGDTTSYAMAGRRRSHGGPRHVRRLDQDHDHRQRQQLWSRQLDLFRPRCIAKTDLGGNVFTYGYDKGGRLTSQSGLPARP